MEMEIQFDLASPPRNAPCCGNTAYQQWIQENMGDNMQDDPNDPNVKVFYSRVRFRDLFCLALQVLMTFLHYYIAYSTCWWYPTAWVHHPCSRSSAHPPVHAQQCHLAYRGSCRSSRIVISSGLPSYPLHQTLQTREKSKICWKYR